MQVCLCGMPGLFLFDIKDCLVALYKDVFGVDVPVFVLNDATSTIAHFGRNSADHEILLSALPTPQLKYEIKKRNLPLLIAVENAIDCINLEITRGHKDYIQLLQLLTASMAGLIGMEHTSTALLLDCPKMPPDSKSVLENLVSWFAHLSPHPVPSTFAHTLLSGGSFREIVEKEQQDNLLAGDDLKFAKSICTTFEKSIFGDAFTGAYWPARFFFNGGTYTRPSNRKCELVGPARVLYFGPYLHLPTGHWKGTLTLGFDDLIPDVRLRIDVYSDVVHFECTVPVRANGVFTLPFSFNHRHSEKALEVRIFLENGEIKGVFWFGGVTLDRIGPALADGEDDVE